MTTPDVRFDDSARDLLSVARDEARRLHHEYIGTEHLALALTRPTHGVVGTVMESLHVDAERVRAALESVAPPGATDDVPEAELPYTSRTQRVFSLAKESALALGRADVGAEHLLVGVLQERVGIGGQVLLRHGLSEAAVLDELRR